MTKDKFQVLCEQVLVPRIADVLRRELLERDELLEIMSREMARHGEQLGRIFSRLDAHGR